VPKTQVAPDRRTVARDPDEVSGVASVEIIEFSRPRLGAAGRRPSFMIPAPSNSTGERDHSAIR
jgi:hypothetical protein